jgi:hypothetical protein
MTVDRELLEQVVATITDDYQRAGFVGMFSHVTDINESVNPHGGRAAPQWMTMLSYNAMVGNQAAVTILLDAGADPMAGSPNAVMELAGHSQVWRSSSDIQILSQFITHGVDLNFTSEKGGTALTSLARFARNPLLAQALIEEGADPSLGAPHKRAMVDVLLGKMDSVRAPTQAVR